VGWSASHLGESVSVERGSEEETARPEKRMSFSGSAKGKHSGKNHKLAVAAFDREVTEMVRATPELVAGLLGTPKWSLSDAESNKAEGEDPVELLEEFQTHGLAPRRLFRFQMNRPDAQREQFYELACSYGIDGSVGLEVTGPKRIVVDGLKAQFTRIVERVANAAAQSERDVAAESPVLATGSSAVADEGGRSWLKRTWRDHATTAVLTLGGGVVVGGILAYLNWN
jgi:hypothetical protein